MSLQDIRQHEHTDEAKASAALPVLNRDSFPRALKLNNNRIFFTARKKICRITQTYKVYWTTHVLSGAESFQSFKNKSALLVCPHAQPLRIPQELKEELKTSWRV